MPIDANPLHLYPPFRALVGDVLIDLNEWCTVHWAGHTAAIAEGFRTKERQEELYAQGRTAPGLIVTDCDGVNTPSEHQTCMAADIVGMSGGQLTWDCPSTFWDYLTHLSHLHGLERTMDYSSFVDEPHIQWPHKDVATYSKARAWKESQGLV
jgi:peptidoglycan L-alanyl-D-glutamate endopeptidase CwlK